MDNSNGRSMRLIGFAGWVNRWGGNTVRPAREDLPF